ncbi:TPA: hypothetical protein ACXHW4_004201 [Enterobacter hormaechei]
MRVDISYGADLEKVSVEDAIAHYGLSIIIEAIGGFSALMETSWIKTGEVVAWLEEQGYTVERN